MKTKTLFATMGFLAALFTQASHAATIWSTATANNWSSTAAWVGGVVPTGADTAIITNGATITINDSRTTGFTIVTNAGKLKVNSGLTVTLGDLDIRSGGGFSWANSASFTFSGNVTNNGQFPYDAIGGLGSSYTFTYSGSGKTLAGSITNQTANFTGTYQNLGTLALGQGNAVAQTLTGTGALTNRGLIVHAGNAAPTIATLVTTTQGNTYVHNNGQMGTFRSGTFYNIGYGAGGGSLSLSGVTNILNNLIIANGGNFPTWPTTLALGGALHYNDDSSGTFATAVSMSNNASIGGFGAAITASGVFNDGGNARSLTKVGTATWTMTAANTYSGATRIERGTLQLNDNNGSINDASELTFVGTGTFTVDNTGAAAARNENMAALTFSAGDGEVRSTRTAAQNAFVTFSSLASRSTGAVGVFGNVGGTLGTQNKIILTGQAAGFINQGLFQGTAAGSGANYAYYDSGGYVRAAIYGTDAGFVSSAGGATMGAVSGNHLNLTVDVTAQTDVSINTLRLAPGVDVTLDAGQTLILANGGLLKQGGGAVSIISGGLAVNNNGVELVARSDASADLLTINTPIIGSGAFTKSGAGTVTLGAANTYNGNTYVNAGTLTLAAGGSIGNSPVITVNAGATLSLGAAKTLGSSSPQDLRGSGTISGALVTLDASGTIHPGGAGTYGTLSFGTGLTLNSATIVTFDLGNAAQGTNFNDRINVTGTFTPGNANVVINPGSDFGPGVYTLVAGSAAPVGSFNSTVTFASGSASGTISTSGNNILLTVSSFASCSTPSSFSVTGGTGCSDTGVTVGLSGSELGTTYTLKQNGTNAGSPIAGTGSAISFGNLTTAGTYTVVGTNGCGSGATMIGSATVNQAPSVYTLTNGDGCSSPGVTVTLGASDIGITYQLLRDNVPVGSPTNAATVNGINFGLQTTPGSYSVQATNATCAAVMMTGTNVITATPNAPTSLLAIADDSQVTISWTAPGSGPAPTGYNVKRSTTSGSGYTTLGAGANVSGSPFTDTTAVNGTVYYYVVSSLNGSCESTNSAPEAAATPNPNFSAFTITGSGSVAAGDDNQLTITAVDTSGATVTGISGDIALTFSGLAAAPNGSLSTVKDRNGVARNLGVVTTINFMNGVGSTASGAGMLVAHKAESATLQVSDGTHSSTSTGGFGLSLTVSAGADSAYRITTTNTAPVVGDTNTLTLAIVDQYQNPSSFTGTKNITFGGLGAAPDGSLPTVDGVPFGTATAINFSSSASAGVVAHKAEVGALLSATDGTLSTTGTGGTAPTFSPTFGAATQLGIVTQPSSSATAGIAFAQQPVVVVLDTFANAVSNSTASVTATASAGAPQGATSVNANGSNGRATFSGLSLTNAGSITLAFSSTGLISTNSSGITVSANAVANLVWTTQPGAATHGSPFGTQPALRTVDQYGNTSTTSLPGTITVTVSLSGGGTLIGTTSTNIGTSGGNGTVAFTDLQINGAGAGKQLLASTAGSYGAPPAGMALWLDSSVASSVITNASGFVTNWNDLSGNGHHFSYGFGANSTVYTNVSSPSGRKVVTFVGTGALTNRTYTNTSANLSVFVVTKNRVNGQGNGGQYPSPLSGTDGVSADFAWQLATFYFELGQFGTRASMNRGSGGTFGFEDYGVYNSSAAYHTLEYVTTSGTKGFWINGTRATAAQSAAMGNFNLKVLCLGNQLVANAAPGSSYLDGDISEVLIYNSDESANRAAIESYLFNKWQSASFPDLSATTAPFTVDKAVSSGAFASSLNPSGFGDSVTFTNAVTGVTTPTGDVIFRTNDAAWSTIVLSTGVATITTATLPRGTISVAAEYAGDSNFHGVTNSLVQTVTNHPPVAGNDYYTRVKDFSVNVRISDLLTNDSDLDFDAIQFIETSATTTNGTLLSNNGTFILVPTNNVNDAFTYTIHDGQGGTNSGTVIISLLPAVFGSASGNVTVTATNVTAVLSGIADYNYSVQRATNVNFTLGVTNFPPVTAPASGQITNIDDFSDLFGSPNINVPDAAYYRLRYNP
ncbi:MAG: putative outer rane autotransporter [Pedosphaera sp.]|nr:putative outer rane autotransporter [Pedosphaera sp.]